MDPEGGLVVNPRRAESMRRKLSGWGYPRYLVDRLKPWSLMDFYSLESKKRSAPVNVDSTIDLSVVVIDNDVDPSLDSQIINTAERIKLTKTPEKYKGVVVTPDSYDS